MILDNSASITNTITYDAFGEITSGVLDDRYGYTGREWDETLGLWFYRDRVRDSVTFYSEDPLGLTPDTNAYRYVGNGPTNGTDPSGRTVFIPASDVGWWRAAGEGNIGFLPLHNGTYQVVLGPGGRNGALHERIKAALLANGMSEGDVGLTLNALYEGGVGERNPAYSQVHDQFVAFDQGDQSNRRRSASITHPYNRGLTQSDYWTPAAGVNNWNRPTPRSASANSQARNTHWYDPAVPFIPALAVIRGAGILADEIAADARANGNTRLAVAAETVGIASERVESLLDGANPDPNVRIRNQIDQAIRIAVRADTIYTLQRETGEPVYSSAFNTIRYFAAELSGITQIERALEGTDPLTGCPLSTAERINDFGFGAFQLVMTAVGIRGSAPQPNFGTGGWRGFFRELWDDDLGAVGPNVRGSAPGAPARVPPTTVPGVGADRVAHFNRAGYQNYRLETNVGTPENPVWRVHYHGYIAPGETAAAITRRHAGRVGPDGLARFNPATDRIVMEPGTRLYGEARLMETRRITQDGTNIGRVDVSRSRRGNNQGGLDPAKLPEYEAWEQALHGR